MKKLTLLTFSMLFILSLFLVSNSFAKINKIHIVAAENFYGDVAKIIGGKYVSVTNIIEDPNQDPHTFTSNKINQDKFKNAQIIIYNGADYDNHWINSVLKHANPNTIIINVADLVGVKNGENPHIWYNGKTFPALAMKLKSDIIKKIHRQQL